MIAPSMKMTVKPSSDRLRPNLSFSTEAKMAPKKQPAVSRETTFCEMCAFVLLAKPVLPVGRWKSFLKLANERTEDITPVSYPVYTNQNMFIGEDELEILTEEQRAHIGYAGKDIDPSKISKSA
jgi:hypothetical protein